jgi:hypothetical protein
LKAASALEAIALHNPRKVSLRELTNAMTDGLAVLKRVLPLRGGYLLKGATSFARRDWGTSLSNLWIAIEQITSALWVRHVVEPTCRTDTSKARRNQLADTRTWTASARLELLCQKGLIPQDLFEALSKARKARNELSHSGSPPSEMDAVSSYAGVCGLLRLALDDVAPAMTSIDLHDHAISDPISPKSMKIQPSFWMEIPKLPGEADLERAEAASRNA